MNRLECPYCKHEFLVEDYDSGICPLCKQYEYYWDDDWNYETEEEGSPGFYWDEIKKGIN